MLQCVGKRIGDLYVVERLHEFLKCPIFSILDRMRISFVSCLNPMVGLHSFPYLLRIS